MVAVIASAQLAAAQGPAKPAVRPVVPPPKPPAQLVVGATELVRLTPATGFIDDAIALDGTRLAYVVADSAAKAALHVVALPSKDEQIVDISTITLQPTAITLVGERAFVVGRSEDGAQVAGLVELSTKHPRSPAGTVIYKLGPAAHITAITRDGKPRIAVHRATETAGIVRHHTELVALETGRRVAAGKPLELDATATSTKLELRVNHWSDGYTRAHGIKAGTWNRKENVRGADVEATFDLVTGKVASKPIADLFDQRRRFQALADATHLDFVRVAPDGTPQLWRAGVAQPLALDQPWSTYDPASLLAQVGGERGESDWLALKVDPVNPEAVARQKADPEYLDVFRVSGDGKAARVARVYAAKLRVRFGAAGNRFWILERNHGLDRGGTALVVYQLP